jgi:hypothetical protein
MRQRLRNRYPSLPIVVGIWKAGDGEQAFQQLDLDNASFYASTLGEAVQAAHAALAQASPSAIEKAAV